MSEAPRRHPKNVYRKVYRCGKIGYSSYNRSLAARQRIAKQEEDELDVYKCSRCGMFHLGHQSKESILSSEQILSLWSE